MEDFNLNELELNLDDDFNMDDMFELSTIDDSEVIDEPHFKIPTKDFLVMLRKAKTIISSASRDLVTKAVAMEVVDGKLHMRCTDFDVYMDLSCPLINQVNLLDKIVVTPIDNLIQLAKALPSTTTILNDNGNIKIRLIGGSMDLETIEIPKEKFIMKDEVKEDLGIDAEAMLNILTSFTPMVQASVNPMDKRIVFNKDGATSVYMFTLVNAPGNFPEFDVKVKDLQVLKVLLNKAKGQLRTYRTIDEKASSRFVIEGDTFKYAFLIGNAPVNKILVDNFNNKDYTNGGFIEYPKLSKLVELSSSLNYTTGKVKLALKDTNTLVIHIPSKNGDNVFTIDFTPNGNVQVGTEVEIASKLFMTILKSFQKNTVLTLDINEDYILLSNNDIKGLILLDA